MTRLPHEMTPGTPQARKVVVVLGMHRSGTSLAARAVNVLGIELGDNLWNPRGEDNPSGFWEDRDVVELNERVLKRLGITWKSAAAPDSSGWTSGALDDLQREAAALLESRLARYDPWGFKDPRTARLLPFWKQIFGTLRIKASYLLTVRNPVNVAASLTRRDGLPELHSHILWLEHMHGALAETTGEHRIIVDYDTLVEQPVEQLNRLARALDVELTAGIAAAISDFATAFVADELRHNRRAPEAGDPMLPEIAARLYALLRDIALGRRGDDGFRHELDEADRALRDWSPVRVALDQAEARLVHARDAIVERDYWLGELRSQITRLGEEKAEVERTVREHGARLQDFYEQIVQLRTQKEELETMVRDRGAQLQDFYAEIERLRDAYDMTLADLTAKRAELARIKKHWYWYIARLIIR